MRFIKDLTPETIKLLNRIYKQSSHYQVKQRAHCMSHFVDYTPQSINLSL